MLNEGYSVEVDVYDRNLGKGVLGISYTLVK